MGLDAGFKRYLAGRFQTRVRFDEPMSAHTSLAIGGPADAYVMPTDEEELLCLLKRLKMDSVPYHVIGGGTNLLVRDRGIRGVVISLAEGFTGISQAAAGRNRVSAMAGARLATLCRYALANSLAGMNFAIGIPGTVGGGIVMNAGSAFGSMEGVVENLRVAFDDGDVETIDKSLIDWSYRGVAINRPGRDDAGASIVLSAGFRLIPADPDGLKKDARAVMEKRKAAQPMGVSTAGCFFKNPASGDPAGRLIDQAGLKGFRVGDAMVSEKHANFVVNLGRAAAEDVIRVIVVVQETVYRKFGRKLEPEVKIVGE